jgi:hypothetical protein
MIWALHDDAATTPESNVQQTTSAPVITHKGQLLKMQVKVGFLAFFYTS